MHDRVSATLRCVKRGPRCCKRMGRNGVLVQWLKFKLRMYAQKGKTLTWINSFVLRTTIACCCTMRKLFLNTRLEMALPLVFLQLGSFYSRVLTISSNSHDLSYK